MSLSLVEALSQVDLKPGRTYRCRVKDRMVELRVGEVIPSELLPAPLNESDIMIMLEPWVEFPQAEGGIILRSTPGELPLPDVPEIPTDEEIS
jgi:hypothetical protein